jgi:hypothetical protein
MTVNVKKKLELLQDSSADDEEFDQLLAKLLEVRLSQQKRLLQQYARDLNAFELRFEMETPSFYRRFEAGELGDNMDYFEWAGLFELYQEVKRKVERLEQTV